MRQGKTVKAYPLLQHPKSGVTLEIKIIQYSPTNYYVFEFSKGRVIMPSKETIARDRKSFDSAVNAAQGRIDYRKYKDGYIESSNFFTKEDPENRLSQEEITKFLEKHGP